MNDSEKELIRARIPVEDLVGRYTTLRKSGNRYKALCPFHSEKTPSFHVDPERGLWHCYGACSVGGDIFSFLMKVEGIGFREALERLAEQSGVVLAAPGKSEQDSIRERDRKEQLREALAEADRFFRDRLARSSEARAYCAERGIDHAARERFAIGYAPDAWSELAEHLIRRRIPGPVAEEAGLVSRSRRGDGWIDRFRARIVFPIHDLQERVIGFGGRLIQPAENAPKYLNSPETPLFVKSRTLYALPWARKAIQTSDRVLVVEGYMDALAAHQAGFANVVATLGTSLTDEHVRILGRYTRNIVLSFDADEAGVRAALRAAELFTAAGPEYNLRILSLPPGEDPDSMLRAGKTQGFRDALETARTVPAFRLDALLKANRTDTVTGRENTLREAIAILAEVDSSLEREFLIGELAPLHPAFAHGGGRAEATLRAEVDRLIAGRRWNRPHRPSNSPTAPAGVDRTKVTTPDASVESRATRVAERLLVRALLSNEWRERVLQALPEGAMQTAFRNPGNRAIAEAVRRCFPESLRYESLPPEIAALATSLSIGQPDDEPLAAAVIEGCLERVVAEGLRRSETRLQTVGDGEGKEMDAEALRAWYASVRARKGAGP